VCWSVTAGLGTVDPVRSRDFATRQLLLALRAGEPRRVLRAIAVETISTAAAGGRSAKRTATLLAHLEAGALAAPDPYTRNFLLIARGASAFLGGRWRDGANLCDEANRGFRDQCSGIAWEMANGQLFAVWSLWQLGALGEMVRRIPQIQREAQERGDLFLETGTRIGRPNVVWLAADDPKRAVSEARDAIARWSHDELHLQHYYALMAEVHAHLYVNHAGDALAALDAQWKKLEASYVFRVQNVRIEALHMRARSALASCEAAADETLLLARAEADVRAMERERMPWGSALALALRGAISGRRGDVKRAIDQLHEGEKALEAADMKLWALGARFRRGELMGDAGKKIVEEALVTLSAERVRRPDRFIRVLAPSFVKARRPLPAKAT